MIIDERADLPTGFCVSAKNRGWPQFNELPEDVEGDGKWEVVIGLSVPRQQLPGLNGRGAIHRECEGGREGGRGEEVFAPLRRRKEEVRMSVYVRR